jgi:hypothetical protein
MASQALRRRIGSPVSDGADRNEPLDASTASTAIDIRRAVQPIQVKEREEWCVQEGLALVELSGSTVWTFQFATRDGWMHGVRPNG